MWFKICYLEVGWNKKFNGGEIKIGIGYRRVGEFFRVVSFVLVRV